MQTTPQSSVDLPGIKKLRSGKVREVFDLGETLLFVVTDRISAFDVILPDPIPHKGAVLNQISAFWFKRFDDDPESPRHGEFRRVPEGVAAVSRATRRAFDDREENEAAPGGMRGARLSCRIRLEGISEIAERLRNKTSAGLAAGVAIAGADLHALDQRPTRSR